MSEVTVVFTLDPKIDVEFMDVVDPQQYATDYIADTVRQLVGWSQLDAQGTVRITKAEVKS